MGKEGVPQALARMGTLHQARNVNHIKERWDFAANQEVKINKTLKTGEFIWDVYNNVYNRICLYRSKMHQDNSSKDFLLKVFLTNMSWCFYCNVTVGTLSIAVRLVGRGTNILAKLD